MSQMRVWEAPRLFSLESGAEASIFPKWIKTQEYIPWLGIFGDQGDSNTQGES